MTNGRVQDKVAFVTGAARGQGRSHAVRLAEEGADIIAIDLCDQIDSVPYAMATRADLEETVRHVEALGRRVYAAEADVRSAASLDAALAQGVAELGGLDIVAANAGIYSLGRLENLPATTWQDMLDVNLTGAWNTAAVSIPHLRKAGRGGSIIFTNSTGGLKGVENIGHYVAAKHGLVGLMRSFALELATDFIRVNSVHPGSVDTDMIQNAATYAVFAPEVHQSARTRENLAVRFQSVNAIPIPWMESRDISNAVLWLASDESRYVTGVALPVDAGQMAK